jgi:hypothetical protein
MTPPPSDNLARVPSHPPFNFASAHELVSILITHRYEVPNGTSMRLVRARFGEHRSVEFVGGVADAIANGWIEMVDFKWLRVLPAGIVALTELTTPA